MKIIVMDSGDGGYDFIKKLKKKNKYKNTIYKNTIYKNIQ